MAGIYGEMLVAFPELMETCEVFKMRPRIGAGYGERYDKRKVSGYWSWRKSGKVSIEGESNVPDHQATFWARCFFLGKKTVVGHNDFIEYEGEIFRIIQPDGFTKEGGFYKCLMRRLAGPTDRQVANGTVDGAIRDDY
jgi:hypothetical protein